MDNKINYYIIKVLSSSKSVSSKYILTLEVNPLTESKLKKVIELTKQKLGYDVEYEQISKLPDFCVQSTEMDVSEPELDTIDADITNDDTITMSLDSNVVSNINDIGDESVETAHSDEGETSATTETNNVNKDDDDIVGIILDDGEYSDIDELENSKLKDDFPRGWHRKKEFVSKYGNFYSRGELVEDNFRKFPPTEY